MRITAWDIEASDLVANFGIVLCVGFKDVGSGKPEVLSLLDYTDESGDLIRAEKRLLKEVSRRLLATDVWLTHFGTYYDIPFINTRLIYHQLPVLPHNYAHIDTWKVAKNRLRLRSNRLKTISEFLGTEEEKNAIRPEQWIRALGGHPASMRYIVEHCRRDVVVLEQAYHRIRSLVADHPSRNLVDGRGGCGVCGAHKLQARGYRLTRTRKYRYFQCQKCGKWQTGTKPVEVVR